MSSLQAVVIVYDIAESRVGSYIPDGMNGTGDRAEPEDDDGLQARPLADDYTMV
jgi:hypothetical protein